MYLSQNYLTKQQAVTKVQQKKNTTGRMYNIKASRTLYFSFICFRCDSVHYAVMVNVISKEQQKLTVCRSSILVITPMAISRLSAAVSGQGYNEARNL